MFEKKDALEDRNGEGERTVIDLAQIVGAMESDGLTVVLLSSGHSVALDYPYREFTELLIDRNWEIVSREGQV